ncbi:MAG: DNA primase [Clostridia bacterium]|nr:DNA primase [Clostridia bacterium]
MAYPAEFLEELKKRNRIVDVINSYVPLKRAGNLYTACCPFHNEKTPSFTVYERTESFYCFGCGVGGDVVSFVMKADNIDYGSAIEQLAQRAGLTVPDNGYDRESSDRRRRILDANREAAKYFHNQLTSGKYKEATDYISGRGLTAAVRHFGLGYSPPDKKLFTYLTDLGYKPNELADAFLVNRGGYSTFEHRIVFPIIDAAGNVVGFSARSLEKKPAEGQKYKNTNDTPAFSKRRNLYAMNFAKNSKEDFFILCEGQTDVIALHMSGFTNAIASLGTSFSEEQAALIRRYKNKVVICYDGDAPGIAKTNAVIKILSDAGVETKVVSLPDGCDPDEFINKYGKERFSLLLQKSIGQMDYRCGQVLSSYDLRSADQKTIAADKLADVIASVYSPVEREIYTVKYAKQLEVSEESFKTLIEIKHKKLKKANKKEEQAKIIRQSEGYGDRVNPDKLRMTRAANAEEAILGIAQISPEFLIQAEKDGVLNENDFKTNFNHRVYTALLDCVKNEGKYDISFISSKFTPDETGRITRMLISRTDLTDNSYGVFTEYARALREDEGPKENGAASYDDIQALINKKK